jgi:hypothetical protein
MTLNRITRSAMLGLALIALGAPVAGARVDTPLASSQPIAVAQDLRSPDARDAAKATNAMAGVDLRSPDAKDGYVFARSPSVGLRSAEPIDLRTPDAVDAGRPISSTPHAAVADTNNGGADWGDIGIAIGAVVFLIGVFALAGRRSLRRRLRAAALSR